MSSMTQICWNALPLYLLSNIHLSSYHSALLLPVNINVFLMKVILGLALEEAIS